MHGGTVPKGSVARAAALLNVLDNRGGRERWAAYREPPTQS